MTTGGVPVPPDAVTAWRYWQLSPATGRLRSVSQRRFEWRPRHVLRASCVGGGHRPPDETCGCGIYGAPDLASLRDYGLCLTPGGLVVGEVALWGRTVPDTRGYRAEYAYPERLWLVEGSVPEDDVAQVTASLAEYAVPVGTIPVDRAVAGISAELLAFQAMSRLTAIDPPTVGGEGGSAAGEDVQLPDDARAALDRTGVPEALSELARGQAERPRR
jgi:hypothetical protein